MEILILCLAIVIIIFTAIFLSEFSANTVTNNIAILSIIIIMLITCIYLFKLNLKIPNSEYIKYKTSYIGNYQYKITKFQCYEKKYYIDDSCKLIKTFIKPSNKMEQMVNE